MADGPAGIRICKIYKIVDGKAKRSGQSAGRNDGIPGSGTTSDDGCDGAEADGKRKKKLRSIMRTVQQSRSEQRWHRASIPRCVKLGDLVGKEMEQFGVHLCLHRR